MFQSTHSRGVRLLYPNMDVLYFKFQSTHSRGVRQNNTGNWGAVSGVSIHALTRSATDFSFSISTLIFVSIHALTRSATVLTLIISLVVDGFNPRTHEECDNYGGSVDDLKGVSIHALTRSATCFEDDLFLLFNQVSIHALTRSATTILIGIFNLGLFQSTHSRGVRLTVLTPSLSDTSFQSTHSRGVRHTRSGHR